MTMIKINNKKSQNPKGSSHLPKTMMMMITTVKMTMRNRKRNL